MVTRIETTWNCFAFRRDLFTDWGYSFAVLTGFPTPVFSRGDVAALRSASSLASSSMSLAVAAISGDRVHCEWTSVVALAADAACDCSCAREPSFATPTLT
eukprot:792280-Prymnesium_polylepis.1